MFLSFLRKLKKNVLKKTHRWKTALKARLHRRFMFSISHSDACDWVVESQEYWFILIWIWIKQRYIQRIITWMCGNMKFIWSVDQDISDKWAKRMSEISCSTREITSYFQTFMYCSVYYIKKTVLLPHKNRAVNSNAFHDNRHMWDYHE